MVPCIAKYYNVIVEASPLTQIFMGSIFGHLATFSIRFEF
jgi:hypothetical protein